LLVTRPLFKVELSALIKQKDKAGKRAAFVGMTTEDEEALNLLRWIPRKPEPRAGWFEDRREDVARASTAIGTAQS